MKNVKNELQNLILGNEPTGSESKLKKTQDFLRRNAESGVGAEKIKPVKNQEEIYLTGFLDEENLWFSDQISELNFIAEGAEQKVYKFGKNSVFKLNDGIFYESWLDYCNSLLIHNFFFQSTEYSLLGFKKMNDSFYAVVEQDFILATEPVDLEKVKEFLDFNQFKNIRNHDYFSKDLGIILEDLHDENILSRDQILYFIDTVFYLTPEFYQN